MKNKVSFPIVGLLLVCALLCQPLNSQAWPYSKPKKYAAMFSLGGWCRDYSERLEIAVWIPGTKPEVYTEFEGWPLLRFGGKVPEPTHKYPLILISHDSMGNRFSLHDLAEALAREGFVVAAPTHGGDNMDDMSKAFTFDALLGKPRQLVLTLETLLDSSDFSPYIDARRIGVIGVGVGAAAALQLGGAAPKANGWAGYCADASPDDSYCQPVIRQLMDTLVADLKKFQASPMSFLLTPPLYSDDFTPPPPPAAPVAAVKAPAPGKNAAAKDKRTGKKPKNKVDSDNLTLPPNAEQLVEQLAEQLTEQRAGQPATQPTGQLAGQLAGSGKSSNATISAGFAQNTPAEPQKIPRSVKSLLLLTPGNSFFFTPDSLKADLPVAVFCAENDEVYPIEKHALPLSGVLPGMPYQVIFGKADHYSLLTPLPRKLTETLPELAGAASFKERQKILYKRDAEAILFFKATLGAPIELPPAPSSQPTVTEAE